MAAKQKVRVVRYEQPLPVVERLPEPLPGDNKARLARLMEVYDPWQIADMLGREAEQVADWHEAVGKPHDLYSNMLLSQRLEAAVTLRDAFAGRLSPEEIQELVFKRVDGRSLADQIREDPEESVAGALALAEQLPKRRGRSRKRT